MLDKILGVAEDNKKVFNKMDKTLQSILKSATIKRKEDSSRQKTYQQFLERLEGDKGVEAKEKNPLIETNKKLDDITELLEDLVNKKLDNKDDGDSNNLAGLGAGAAGLLGKGGGLLAGLKGLAVAAAPFAAVAGGGALALAGLKNLGEFFSGMKDGKQVKTSVSQEMQFGGNASVVAGIQRDQKESKDPFKRDRGGMDNDYQRRGGNVQSMEQGFVTPKQQDEQRQVYVELFEDLNNDRERELKESDVVTTVGKGKSKRKKRVEDKEKRAEINADFDARKQQLLQRYEELFGELEQIESRDAEEPVAKARGGSVWKVPGSGSGDKPNPKTGRPYQLKPGSFVLNRNASNFLNRQEGGTVPAVLEPGELVFPKTTSSLKELNKSVPRFQEGGQVDSGGFKLPLTKGRVGTAAYQIFGASRDGGGRLHAGVDLVENAPWGENPMLPCVAAKDGEVLQERYTQSGYVAGLIIRQNDGYDSRYVHMTPEVSPGTKVKAGDRVGKLIDLKDNSHLHYELYKNGSTQALDPTSYLKSAGKSSPSDAGSVPGMGDNPDGKTGEETGPARGDASTAAEDATKKDPKKGGALRDILAGILGVGGAIGGAMLGNKIKELVPGYTVGGAFGMKMSPAMSMAILGAGLGGATANALTGGGEKTETETKTNPGKSSGTSVGETPSSNKPYDIASSMGFSKEEWDIYRNTVGHIESGNVYDIAGGSGGHYDGRWQLGDAAKKDAASYLGEEYSGHGAGARASFQKDGEMQEKYFAAFTAKNHSYLTGTPEYDSLSTKEKFEVLGYAHNQGAGGAREWLQSGEVRSDGFGTKATKYSEALNAAYSKPMQQGGSVQALLEGGEMVFPQSTPELESLNASVPRFQTGGTVGMSGKTSQSKTDFMEGSKKQTEQPMVIVNNVSAPPQQSHGGEGPRPVSHSAPPTLSDGPNMAALSDIINRVGWSNVF